MSVELGRDRRGERLAKAAVAGVLLLSCSSQRTGLQVAPAVKQTDSAVRVVAASDLCPDKNTPCNAETTTEPPKAPDDVYSVAVANVVERASRTKAPVTFLVGNEAFLSELRTSSQTLYAHEDDLRAHLRTEGIATLYVVLEPSAPLMRGGHIGRLAVARTVMSSCGDTVHAIQHRAFVYQSAGEWLLSEAGHAILDYASVAGCAD